MIKDIINILGTGGHAKVIIDAVILSGNAVSGLFDDDSEKWGSSFGNCQIKGAIDNTITGLSVIAIGNNRIRKKIQTAISNAKWKTVIHPTAIIAEDVIIGEGTVIMAGAIIQAGTVIGAHCIINTGACIDHDCIIEDFVHIAPNCSLAGGIKIGEGTFVGIGSSIIQNKIVGSWTTVGAGSVVIQDIPDNCIAVGVPASLIKYNNE